MTEKLYPFSHDKEQTDETCCVCGRKAGRFMALVVDGGGRFGDPTVAADMDENDPGFMGWWPIGATCKRKLPKHYVRKVGETEMTDQERIIEFAIELQEVGVTGTEIGKHLGIKTPAATRLAKALVKEGKLVETDYMRRHLRNGDEYTERRDADREARKGRRMPAASIVYIEAVVASHMDPWDGLRK